MAADVKPHPVVIALAQQRKAWGLSVDDVAERSRCTHSYLEKLECGHRTPSLRRLTAWAEALGYEVTVRPKID